MVAKVMDRWSVSTRALLKFDMESFNLKILTMIKLKIFTLKSQNRFRALENIIDNAHIDRAW